MHALAIPSFVLAQTRPINFDLGPRPLNTTMLLALGGIGIGIAVIFVTGWLVRSYLLREKKAINHPGKLFAELCKAHQLTGARRSLLKRLAAAQGMEPALLFVDPESFDTTSLGPAWEKQQPALESLRDTIFGQRIDSPTELVVAQAASL